jgi:hypothetical protein
MRSAFDSFFFPISLRCHVEFWKNKKGEREKCHANFKKKKTDDAHKAAVCERRVDLLVCSLPLHRHSYIGFILAFASSIHNKQQVAGGAPETDGVLKAVTRAKIIHYRQVYFREAQNCRDKKTLIFFLAFAVLSGKFGNQSLRFRPAKTFFFNITIFLYQNKNPVAHMIHWRQFCASLTT